VSSLQEGYSSKRAGTRKTRDQGLRDQGLGSREYGRNWQSS
jgi:hypothetical protein